MRSVLLTGGAGYIGTHILAEVLPLGFEATVVDNFSNSSPLSVDRVNALTGKRAVLYRADVRDTAALTRVIKERGIDCVVHLAGLKAVAEGETRPVDYYDNNVGGTIALLRAMRETGLKNLIFSSSATVYGQPERLPLTEDCRLMPFNVYGRTKLVVERLLADACEADKDMNVTMLRYFNPVGAHKSGLIGEQPGGTPNNLMPYIAKVALGQLSRLSVFGDDYPTPDGTGVRDYIHITDLALGHLAAMQNMGGFKVYNLGTGQGHSVLEVLRAFEAACGKKVPYTVCARRIGDLAEYYASPEKAAKELNWRAKRTLSDMCADYWRWTSLNPRGYI